MPGLTEDIDLDISDALRDIDKLEAALESTARHFKVEVAKALNLLRQPAKKIDLRVDDKGSIKRAAHDLDTVESEARQAEHAADKLSGRFDGVRAAAAGALAAFGTRAVVNEIGKMISAASDLAESQSKVSVVFGDSADEIEEWGETSATSVGLAKQQALEAAGTFGNLFTALGLSKDAAADLSPQVVQLGADFASFNNLEVPETLEKLRSGLVGEVEPLRSLGISFNAAQVEAKAMELGLADASGEISEGAKVQARWALVVEQSSAAQGDFARTSDGLANQQRILSAEIGNARAEIGARLLPVMLKVVQLGRGFLDFFLDLPEPVQDAALAFLAIGAALGPFVLIAGNISKTIGGVGAAIKGLSTLLGTSTLVIGGWAAALVAVGAVIVAFNRFSQARSELQATVNDNIATAVNREALLADTLRSTNEVLRDQATAAFISAGGLGTSGDAAEDLAVGTRIANEHLEEITEQAPKAAAVLRALAEESGITKERIVQLADSMGINLATATDEQREKLGTAIAEISAAQGPTSRLAETEEVLGNQFATTKEQIDAFREALDAALGVHLSAEEATIRVRQQLDELAEAYKTGAKEGETAQQFQDRLTLSTIDLTKKVQAEVDALVESGDVATDAASQQDALTSRLLALADTLGGPMADELRKHVYRIASIPAAHDTEITADTRPIEEELNGLPALVREKGRGVGDAFVEGIVAGLRDDEGRIVASADRIAHDIEAATKKPLGIKSPSTVGMEIGGFFVEGIALGIAETTSLAEQQSEAAMLGLTDVWQEASAITADEALRIFEAMDKVREAQMRLNWIMADATSTEEQKTRASLEVAAAQEDVNDAVFDALDATDALTDATNQQTAAIEERNRALDQTLDALASLGDLEAAQRRVERAERDLAEARQRQLALPTLVAAAEARLAAARSAARRITADEELRILRAQAKVSDADAAYQAVLADGTSTAEQRREKELELTAAKDDLAEAQADATSSSSDEERALRELNTLKEEAARIDEEVEEKSRDVIDAQLDLVQAQRDLNEVGAELSDTNQQVIDDFVAIAEQAGLTEDAIRSLTDSLEGALGVATGAAAGEPALVGAGGASGGVTSPGTPLTPAPWTPPWAQEQGLDKIGAFNDWLRGGGNVGMLSGVQVGPNYLTSEVDVDLVLNKTEFAVKAGKF